MRAGPLSDETVIRLINRRFISYHFDLNANGYLGDHQATKWVKQNVPEFSGSAVSTPPVLFVSPDGKILGRVSNYAPTEVYLSELKKVLKENPDFNQFSKAESELVGIERAQMLFDLQDYEEAIISLKGDESNEANYLRGRVARWQGDWKTALNHYNNVTEDSLADDVTLEKSLRHWTTGNYESLKAALTNFPLDSNRASEARYYLGLAHYHLGDENSARKVWKDLVESATEGPWVYRADWAYSEAKKGNKKASSFSFGGSTLLKRIGYMGSKHPDLQSKDVK